MDKKKKVTTTVTTTVTEEIIDVKNEITEIICILDRSGSMSSIIHDMIGGFNQYIEDQKKIEGKCNITIALFDDRYELLYDNVDIQKFKPLTKADWYPRGSTALYDAIGKTINDVDARVLKSDVKPDKFLVCVVTDGYENSSREFNKNSIKKLISKKENEKYSFLYLAANQDAMLVGDTMGFGAGNTLNFNASSSGAFYMNSSLSTATAHYRSVSTSDALYSKKCKNIISDSVGSNGTVDLGNNNVNITTNNLTFGSSSASSTFTVTADAQPESKKSE